MLSLEARSGTFCLREERIARSRLEEMFGIVRHGTFRK